MLLFVVAYSCIYLVQILLILTENTVSPDIPIVSQLNSNIDNVNHKLIKGTLKNTFWILVKNHNTLWDINPIYINIKIDITDERRLRCVF